jgi:hypothetical protein
VGRFPAVVGRGPTDRTIGEKGGAVLVSGLEGCSNR